MTRHTAATCIALLLGAVVRVAAADPVAVVNGEPIERADFGLSLVRVVGRRTLTAQIGRVLIEQEARRQGITLSDEELDERLEMEIDLQMLEVIAGMRLAPDEFRRGVRGRGMKVEDIRAELALGISRDALRAAALAERLIAPQFDLSEGKLREHYDRTRGKRFSCAHIQVIDRRLAGMIIKALEKDMSLWTRMVMDQSLDRASVPHKGRLVPVAAGSDLGRLLEQMQAGELRLYESGSTYRIIRRIEEIAPTDEPFEELTDRLRAEIVAQGTKRQYYRLVATLTSGAHVVENLSWDPQQRRELGEETAMFVNGEALTVDALADVLAREYGRIMLEPYVERVLIEQEARRKEIDLPEGALGEKMAAIAADLFRDQAAAAGMTADELTDALARGGSSAEEFKRLLLGSSVPPEEVRATMLAERLVAGGVQVSAEEVEEAYDAMAGPQVRVKVLKAANPVEAEALLGIVRRGVSFELAARARQQEPGGWMTGWLETTVSPGHELYVHVSERAPGDVTDVVSVGGRYAIIRVLERRVPSDVPPIESVYDELADAVRRRKSRSRIRALILRLKAEADIQVLL